MSGRRGIRRLSPWLLLLAVACGRYGPPVRAARSTPPPPAAAAAPAAAPAAEVEEPDETDGEPEEETR